MTKRVSPSRIKCTLVSDQKRTSDIGKTEEGEPASNRQRTTRSPPGPQSRRNVALRLTYPDGLGNLEMDDITQYRALKCVWSRPFPPVVPTTVVPEGASSPGTQKSHQLAGRVPVTRRVVTPALCLKSRYSEGTVSGGTEV